MLVVAAIYRYRTNAYLDKARLEAAGIMASIFDDHEESPEMRLMVLKDDLKYALDILAEGKP